MTSSRRLGGRGFANHIWPLVKSSEKVIREQLFAVAKDAAGPTCAVVEEFWVPGSNERVDLSAVGKQLWAFEIKSPRDSLKRFPRQIHAFSRLFDRCTAVLATKHLEVGAPLLPPWWGLINAGEEVGDALEWQRQPTENPEVDLALLVRLLWRDEAADALAELGIAAPDRLGRQAMWRILLREAEPARLRECIRMALRTRDHRLARIPTRRGNRGRANSRAVAQ